jgi:hypothetical protein
MADQKWYGMSSDEVFAFTASSEDDPNDLAEEQDANYVTDENGANSIRNGLDVLLGDRPEMDNPHSIVDFLFKKFGRISVADALAQHGYEPAK